VKVAKACTFKRVHGGKTLGQLEILWACHGQTSHEKDLKSTPFLKVYKSFQKIKIGGRVCTNFFGCLTKHEV